MLTNQDKEIGFTIIQKITSAHTASLEAKLSLRLRMYSTFSHWFTEKRRNSLNH